IALNSTKKVSKFRLLNSLYELAKQYVSSLSQPNKEKYYLLKDAWLQNQLGSAQIYSTKVIFDIPGLDLQGLAMIIRHWEKEVGPDSPEKDLIATEKEWLTDKYHYNWETLKFEQLSPSQHYRHYISKNPIPSESSLNIQSLGLVQECIARDEASRKEMRALMFFDSRHQHAPEIAQGIEQFQQYLNKSKVQEGKYQTLTYDMQQEMTKRHLLSPSDALAAIIEEQKESPTIHIIKLKKETPHLGIFLNQISCLYDSPNPLLYTHGTDSEKTVSLKKQPLVLVFDETSPEAVENHYLDQNQENELEGFCSLYSRLSGICRL
ncbi:MAG: hypothetical protein K2X66_16275, partial [Cyanobacteria bacterium]|nr:hypothetical protein [Cyanobacteriota bacterium]